jgi:hypothetical protein
MRREQSSPLHCTTNQLFSVHHLYFNMVYDKVKTFHFLVLLSLFPFMIE